MAVIKNLKNKRKKTDEDSIVQELISKGNTEITDKSKINSIFEYAVEMCYIIKSSYGDHYNYKINLEISKHMVCRDCAEDIIPFNCDASKFEAEIPVDVKTFEGLVKELKDIKILLQHINDENIPLKTQVKNIALTNYDIVKSVIDILQEECRKKR